MAYSSKELVPQAARMAWRSSSVWVSPELAMTAGAIRSRPSSGRLQPQHPVQADVDAGRHPVGHVQRPGGGDGGDPPPSGQPRGQPEVVVPAEEAGQVLAPLGPVGHEHPLRPVLPPVAMAR
jgi:hypothetical protein